MSVNEVEMAARYQGSLDLGMAGNGNLRWAVVNLTDIVEEARDRLDLSVVSTLDAEARKAVTSTLRELSQPTP